MAIGMEQQPGPAAHDVNIMQQQQQAQITGTSYEQGALGQLLAGYFQYAGRVAVEPKVAGIRSAGQIGAAQASALGSQLAAQAGAAGQVASAEIGGASQEQVALTRLQGTLAQIAGQTDLQSVKGQQEWTQLLRKLQSQETIAGVQAEASKYGAEQQKAGQTEAATTAAGASTYGADQSRAASEFGSEKQKEATLGAALESASAQRFGATTSAGAQKDVAAMNILGQLGGEGFGDGIIKAGSAAKQAEALQALQAQMGLGDQAGEGTIRKTQQEQLERELGVSQEQAAQQLGLGDYADSGGIIGAQSAAKIAEMQEAGKQKLGTGDDSYQTLGEIAGQGAEQRLTQAQRAELAQGNMAEHARLLDVQQGKMASRLAGIETPFANMFGIGPIGSGQGQGGQARQATSGIDAMQNIAGAGQIHPQTAAMNLLSGAEGNPFMQPLTGLAGMTGAQNAGPNQLLAMQGAMNAQNQLGMTANQNLAQMGTGAAQNLAGLYNQGLATKSAALQPLSTAAGQGLAAVPQAYGQGLAAMGGVGAGMI